MTPRIALTEAERKYLISEQARRKIPWKVVAREIGVSTEALGAWRVGRSDPTSEQLLKWWRAVSAPVSGDMDARQ